MEYSEKTNLYAVADIHGNYYLLLLMIAEISKRGGGVVVFLGDYIDRGPKSRKVIERLMEGPPEGQIWVCLGGNHEQMMLLAVAYQEHDQVANDWIKNGGGATLESYGPFPDGEVTLPEDHLRWLMRLEPYYWTDNHIFVHAGLDPTLPLEEQTEQTLKWKRDKPRDLDYDFHGKHIVHGHTIVSDGPLLLKGRTNLDTGAFHTGVLTAGRFDRTQATGPVEVIQVWDRSIRKGYMGG